MRSVFFTPQARDDLDDITLYIARERLDAAQRFLDAARSTTDRLARQPGLGHRRPDLPQEYLALGVARFTSHILIYRFDRRGVTIVRVLHGARDFSAAFNEQPSP